MSKDRKKLSAKIVIIGDVGVGKSSITIRYIYDKFDLKLESTLGAAYMQKICTFYYNPNQSVYEEIKVNSEKPKASIIRKSQIESEIKNDETASQLKFNHYHLKLQIWDTAGQEKYKAIAKLYYRDCRVAILVYDCTRKQTFQNLSRWYEDLIKNAPANLVLFVVANKIDLLDTVDEEDSVPFQKGEDFAKSISASFFQVSAKANKGVEDLFRSVGDRIGPIVYKQLKRGTNKDVKRSILVTTLPQKRKCCKS